MTINEFRAEFRLIHRIRLEDTVMTEHENIAIREALAYHSLQLPYHTTHVVNSGSFDLTQIQGWGDGWRVLRVFRGNRVLPMSLWSVVGVTLSLGVSGDVLIEYSRPHELDCDGTTLRADEIEPLAHLAAHFLFAQLSNEYTKTMGASIDADAVNWNAQNVSYYTKSQDELKRYQAYASARYRPGSARIDYNRPSRTRERLIFRDMV